MKWLYFFNPAVCLAKINIKVIVIAKRNEETVGGKKEHYLLAEVSFIVKNKNFTQYTSVTFKFL